MSKEEEVLEELEQEQPSLEKPKVKRTMTDKQMETVKINLAKGRAKRDVNRVLKAEQDKKNAEEIVLKKAARLMKDKSIKEKLLKKVIYADDDDDDDVEVEERIIKKPKKKKIVYREESDSEEEVIVKRQPKKVVEEPVKPLPPSRPLFNIKFV